MKNFWIIIFVILITVVLVLSSVSFQVRQTEKALVTRFGKPVRSIDEPGWKRKLPFPIETVHKFDSRINLFEGAPEETTTRGGETIIITSYVFWRIDDPLKFLKSVHDKTGVEKQLRSLLRNTQNEIVGEHYFSEFVNSDPEKIHFDEIENKMFLSLESQAKENYGIEIRSVGIKKLGINEEATKDVFKRMSADRLRKTNTILEQGNAEATRIMADAESKRTELLAVVEARATAIRGEGDAEAAKYYKLLEADPEFAMFLRNIDTLKKILKEDSTIIFGADTEPFELLKGIPDISPK